MQLETLPDKPRRPGKVSAKEELSRVVDGRATCTEPATPSEAVLYHLCSEEHWLCLVDSP